MLLYATDTWTLLSANMWGLWMLSTRCVWDSCLESDGTTKSEMMKYNNGPVWLHCLISCPVDASRYFGMWLDLTTTHRQTWLFSFTSTYHSTDLTASGIAHLVVHRTSGLTSYETISPEDDVWDFKSSLFSPTLTSWLDVHAHCIQKWNSFLALIYVWLGKVGILRENYCG